MEWPARSPDLHPIEHLWDYLGREVAALNPPPRSLHELKQGLLCVWSSLPIPVSDNLINSMGNRCRQCIQRLPLSPFVYVFLKCPSPFKRGLCSSVTENIRGPLQSQVFAPSRILQRVRTWRQLSFGFLESCPPPRDARVYVTPLGLWTLEAAQGVGGGAHCPWPRGAQGLAPESRNKMNEKLNLVVQNQINRFSISQINWLTSQQHLSVTESPSNLEVSPDAPTIDTERRNSEIEIGSKACQSNSDAEISVFTLSNISQYQEEGIEISSSPVNKDGSDVVKQAFSSFYPGLCTFPMTETLTGNDLVQKRPTQQLKNSDEYCPKNEDH
ncbi:DDE_3 domain-containing protein [Trichonephila clavipes]|nr:DDE_3 domain-containing protein [Trichonephila clavipes]